MKNIDAQNHVRGKSTYLDDIPIRHGTLYALAYDAPVAHAKIKSIDYSQAERLQGVDRILTYSDIPGQNEIGGIFQDEPLLAVDHIHFWGMPIALILAKSEYIARQARSLIKIEYEELEIITDPRVAKDKGEIIGKPRMFSLGNTDVIWDQCAHVIEGRADTNGQEHLYIECQGAYAYPTEHGSIRISSSTQGPTAVQKTVAKVLNIPMHKVEVDVTRLGGGFGGKEDQATAWAVMCALAAQITEKPIKYAMHRMDDMRMTGKRHPYTSDYRIGLSADYKILAYEATFYQNAGAAADLSPAVLERTLYHCTNAYYIPNVKACAYSCRTNLPPNTAFRGFGGPQGMFVIESAIVHAADVIGINPIDIQEINLLQKGDKFPYGQIVSENLAVKTWQSSKTNFNLNELNKSINLFNSENSQYKKGMALMPLCFGISFTNTPMNHARALVHIYQDGSIGISTGGVEMGQGVNTKMVQVAVSVFKIDSENIKIESTNTTRVANTSPSAASATADLNGKALLIACKALEKRLKENISKYTDCPSENIDFKSDGIYLNKIKSDLTWNQIINKAFLDRVNLSESGHYSTPLIHFDKSKEKGHPFAYHVFGTAIIEVTVDCLRGRYEFDGVKIIHDFGKSMNKDVDHGQIEGGLIQGIGWMTMEELLYNDKGRLLSNALSTYKIPDIYSVPKSIQIKHADSDQADMAILKSKAVGEPPLMYGIGAYFAIQNAIRAYRPDAKLNFDAPYTPEKVLMSLHG